MSHARTVLVARALPLLLAFAGCDGEPDARRSIADGCNPLGGIACMMPWPSSTYLDVDSATTSGFRVDLPADAMPVNQDGIAVLPTPWDRLDGFSPSGALLVAFPNGVASTGLPPFSDPAASLAKSSPIVLVDVATGDRVPLFAEVDMNTTDPTKRVLIIRPLVRMAPATRYAVGLRDTLTDVDGAPLPRPPGFQAIVDGKSFDHPRFAALAAGYPAIFAALTTSGLPPEHTVLAWDFVTASDESLTSDLLSMRDQALPLMGVAGANLTFSATAVAGEPTTTHALYQGTFDAPGFLSDAEHDDSIIVRDAADLPTPSGTFTANFSAIVPKCVTTATLPIPVLVFGHGLFGDAAGYLTDPFFQKVANDHCVVVLGTDWIGLSSRQLTAAAFTANDFNKQDGISEKLGQAVIDFIALETIARGPMHDAPQFAYQGTPIMDPSRVYYFGASLGGIMGNTFMAYDPQITRGALGVPGGDWSLLLERSFAWTPLQGAAQAAYPNPYDYQILIALISASLERWDPMTTARHVLADPMPGTPTKQLLLYESLNDCLVSNLSTETIARTMGLAVTAPSVKLPFGLTASSAPLSSGLTIYDENAMPAVPTTNVPPASDNGTHAGINKRGTVLQEVVDFLITGEITNHCMTDGKAVACDCTKGVCGT